MQWQFTIIKEWFYEEEWPPTSWNEMEIKKNTWLIICRTHTHRHTNKHGHIYICVCVYLCQCACSYGWIFCWRSNLGSNGCLFSLSLTNMHFYINLINATLNLKNSAKHKCNIYYKNLIYDDFIFLTFHIFIAWIHYQIKVL